jgi:hypothetical protein
MLNRAQLEAFLELMLKEKRIELPEDIELDDIVEAFCQYLDEDLNEWLKIKFSNFFPITSAEDTVDWNWVRENINVL